MTEWRMQRYAALNRRISNILKTEYNIIAKGADSLFKDFAQTIAEGTPTMLNAAVGVNIFGSVTLTEELLESLVTKNTVQGRIIGDWWASQSEDAIARLQALMNKVSQECAVGLIKGESITAMISAVRGTRASAAKGTLETPGALAVSKREATALVRTSVMQIAQDVRQKIYEANADVLKGYQWCATLDTRTTQICRALDGKEWALSGEPIGHSIVFPGPPPVHFQCRSTLIPLTKSFLELQDEGNLPEDAIEQLAKLSAGVRASMGGPVPNVTYSEWLKGQSEEVQLDVLGKRRYSLWRKGKISTFDDLVNQTGRALTLEQLRKRMQGEE
jgi:SPP1 gp7 family putative phage head morphogenesis protein